MTVKKLKNSLTKRIMARCTTRSYQIS